MDTSSRPTTKETTTSHQQHKPLTGPPPPAAGTRDPSEPNSAPDTTPGQATTLQPDPGTNPRPAYQQRPTRKQRRIIDDPPTSSPTTTGADTQQAR